ncbi:MAG: transposase [Armatimonadota bacterium]|nr:MAG: transposase [Armatimonadota bacterium]
MPRVARIVAPGVPYHVTQRGNNRQDVFFADDDRRFYLALLKEQARGYGLVVLGYCLMPNHLHLVVTPRAADSLAKAIGRTHFIYTQYINRLHGRSGHLWHGRFYSCALDEAHCWAALCYVERNPVRAGLVARAWRYEWSSAAAHCGRTDRSRLLDLKQWSQTWDARRWKQWLVRPEDDERMRQVRAHTGTGRPLGSDRFVSRLERILGRRVRPLPVGRPRKAAEDENR